MVAFGMVACGNTENDGAETEGDMCDAERIGAGVGWGGGGSGVGSGGSESYH